MANGERRDAPRRRRARTKSKDCHDEQPRLTEVWRVELTRGLRCLMDGDVERADEHFQRAYRSAPEQAEVCFAMGRERLRRGQLEEAERLLRIAWTGGGMLAAAAALARCLGVDGKRREEAHAVLDEAVRAGGEEPGLLVVRAELFVEAGDLVAARRELERAQAVLDREKREAPATREAIQAALAKVSNLDGIALGAAGRDEEALFAFKRAFDLDPAWSGPLVNMGAVFVRLGRPARARACYERAIVIDADNAVARYNLAELSRQRGDSTTAEGEYRKVLEIDAAYPGARVVFADFLSERGRLDEAIEVVCGGPVELERDHVGACCRLARKLARAGRYDIAAELVRAARRVDPVKTAALLDADRP